MRKYYMQIEGNIINSKGTTTINAELNEGQVETTENFYMSIKIPSSFELDNEGNMINITPLPQPEPEPVIPEPSESELLRDYVLDLDYRLILLELGI